MKYLLRRYYCILTLCLFLPCLTACTTSKTLNIDTNIIQENGKPMAQIGTRNNPLPTNTTVLFNGEDTLYDNYQVEVTLVEVIRGEDALSMVQNAKESATVPKKSKEYLVAKFRLSVLYSENDSKVDVSNASFSLFHSDGSAYDDPATMEGINSNLKDMYAGSTQEGLAYFLVDKDDKSPSIVYLERNKGGIWFSTNLPAKLPQGSKVYVPRISSSLPASVKTTHGSRLNPFQAGDTASYDGMDTLFDTYQAEIKLIDVIRGDEALNIVAEANSYNSLPPINQEYLLARFSIKSYDSRNNATIELSNDCFELVSGQGLKYVSNVTIDNLTPSIDIMRNNSVQEGYTYFLVDKGDENPLIVFLERNHNGIWFSTDSPSRAD